MSVRRPAITWRTPSTVSKWPSTRSICDCTRTRRCRSARSCQTTANYRGCPRHPKTTRIQNTGAARREGLSFADAAKGKKPTSTSSESKTGKETKTSKSSITPSTSDKTATKKGKKTPKKPTMYEELLQILAQPKVLQALQGILTKQTASENH